MTNSHSAVIDAVLDLAQDALTDANYPLVITRGPTGSGNCIAAEPSFGTADRRFYDKNGAFRVTLVFNSKNANMQIALNTLEQILLKLTRMGGYPHAETWEITGIWTNALPMMVSREEDNTWLYAASVYIDYYLRGD
jgi:hypothetical protein